MMRMAEGGLAMLENAVLFPPPPSVFVTAISAISLVLQGYTGWKESMGIHMGYSKMFHLKTAASTVAASKPVSSKLHGQIRVPSRVGMLILYCPSLCAVASLLFISRADGSSVRFLLLRLALTAHFLKRVLEVLFLHKYSGSMDIEAITVIPIGYTLWTAMMIYTQHLSLQLSEPSINLTYPGVFLFILGMCGNFYHHYILSTLRDKGEKGYKMPKGGMFNLVICPHYLFEIIEFLGITCIAQTLYSVSFTLGSLLYLLGRSYATRKWYASKFENFPKHIKALIPYVY